MSWVWGVGIGTRKERKGIHGEWDTSGHWSVICWVSSSLVVVVLIPK